MIEKGCPSDWAALFAVRGRVRVGGVCVLGRTLVDPFQLLLGRCKAGRRIGCKKNCNSCFGPLIYLGTHQTVKLVLLRSHEKRAIARNGVGRISFLPGGYARRFL